MRKKKLDEMVGLETGDRRNYYSHFLSFSSQPNDNLNQKKDTYLLRWNKEERVENDRGDIFRSLVVAIIL